MVVHEAEGTGSSGPALFLVVSAAATESLAVEAVLTGLGHAVRRVSSPDEAGAALQAERFAAVVWLLAADALDEVSRVTREEPLGPVPVLLITDHADPGAAAEAYALGATDVLTIPGDDAALRAKATSLGARFQAMEGLLRANHTKDQFIATVSHELRSPLSAILGWAQVLLEEPPDATLLRQGLEIIERNAKAQAQLIEDLLDVSRIAAGKIELHPVAVAVPALISTALDSARPALEAKRLRLEADVDPGVGSLVADPDRLQQIIGNLLANAVKFTPAEGTIHLGARRAGSQVEIEVRDTGQGIAPELLPHVFEKFRQAERGARKGGGLGLGLAIVRHLVELHGGTVVAESEGVGRGARFTVRIPIRATFQAPVKRAVQVAATGETARAPRVLEGLRLLIVDDEQDARGLVAALLGRAGAEVRTAGSADEALGLLDGEVPDALVSDIGMPGKDGYTLIREIRTRPRERGGRIPAVALTAYSQSEDRARALTAGFSAHIPKPVEPLELIVVLANALGRDVGKLLE